MCAAPSDPVARPWITVVVVNWNGRPLLADCLGSLARAGAGVRVVLVDNGSADDSVAWTREHFPAVEILRSEENLRWAGGNNLALARLREEGGEEPVLLLNNDTLVPEGSLRTLADALRDEPAAWAATPRICYASDPGLLWYDGARVGAASGWVNHLGLRRPAGTRPLTRSWTDYGTGCALLVSRRALDAVGLLDEGYWLYAEDTDYSLRIRAAGGRILHEPRAIVLHKVSVTTGADTPRKAYLKNRSHVQLLRRRWPRRAWLTLAPAQLAYVGAQAAWHLFAGRPDTARAAVQGALDAWTGRGKPDGTILDGSRPD
ncbi:MAG TPA: glycosyltransferase family 2 protein [Candidatus Krumholzibacteria bacterium]|nr:glycosyltransferase family 2 protein [Candidatus Krumholzibacteria bacterium]